jgi:flagellum-specific peptidoglycan hydrolase FlgJ
MKLNKRTHKVVISLFLSATLQAKAPSHRQQYLHRFEHIAIKEMKRSGVPASITLAQGILESGWGKSPLSKSTNNHFGIKCHADWEGERHRTLSETSADVVKTTCYRAYANADQSYKDHTDFLLRNALYDPLFSTHDYRDWAEGLEKAGYAEDDNYAELLVNIIESNELYRYDVEIESPYSEDELKALPSAELLQLIRFALFGRPSKPLEQEIVEGSWSELTRTESKWFNMGLEQVAITETNRRRKTSAANTDFDLEDFLN